MDDKRQPQNAENKEQNEQATKKKIDGNNKHEPPIDNTVTNSIKNTALNETGLNQAQTEDNDLEPGTH
ncbi:MAG: hypothetical protein IPJ81_15270 [Chitinophagaceae bacterium]|nr:hypothetical protein [Chitinophagaceae bacterium]